MATIHVDVVSAEQEIFSGNAKFVALPGEAGELQNQSSDLDLARAQGELAVAAAQLAAIARLRRKR
jgi:F0F1-type ATP synthase epsilon subunit